MTYFFTFPPVGIPHIGSSSNVGPFSRGTIESKTFANINAANIVIRVGIEEASIDDELCLFSGLIGGNVGQFW